MLENLLHILSYLSIVLGSFLLVSGALGLIRFPDFYTRMHAASITDTLAATLIIFGFMLLSGWDLSLLKLGMILLFILFTSPTATHALAKAAQHGGLAPEVSAEKGGKSSKS